MRPGYASGFAFSRTIAGVPPAMLISWGIVMSIDTPSTVAKPGPYQDLGARANLSDQVVTAIAAGLGVVVVALIAVLMGVA